VLSYCIGAAFFNVTKGWRWMLLSGVVPALAQLALSISMPESPRFLILRGKIDPARATLSHLYPNLDAEALERRIQRIEQGLKTEQETTLRVGLIGAKSTGGLVDKLWRDKPNRRALIVACGLQFFQQVTISKTRSEPQPDRINRLQVSTLSWLVILSG
jgi:SP family myo-inositol transporter-like MFS transporter 13